VFSGRRSFGVAIYDLYQQSKRPFIGIYLFFRPAVLIRDAHLAKSILTSDFLSFHDRGVYCNEEADPFSCSLFALPGDKWKKLRQKLTPTFSSGKLKNMMPTILDVAERFQGKMQLTADVEGVLDLKDISARYVLDVIASVIFGIEVDTLEQPDHDFRSIVRASTQNPIDGLRAAANFVCPK
jgi:cytochrome P450 family 6